MNATWVQISPLTEVGMEAINDGGGRKAKKNWEAQSLNLFVVVVSFVTSVLNLMGH